LFWSNDAGGFLAYAEFMKESRVLIADDNYTTRCSILEVLCKDFQIVGVVCDGEELVQSAICLVPDVVVSELLMPRLDGLGARYRLNHGHRAIPFVFVSTLGKEVRILQFPDDESAVGLVYKGEMSVHLSSAVETVLTGRHYISPYYI
jgi:DNA-binding NarL/FixJ family response regulator